MSAACQCGHYRDAAQAYDKLISLPLVELNPVILHLGLKIFGKLQDADIATFTNLAGAHKTSTIAQVKSVYSTMKFEVKPNSVFARLTCLPSLVATFCAAAG